MSADSASGYPRLVGDVGGTNARFARIAAPGGPLEGLATYPTSAHPRLQDVLAHYIGSHGGPRPRWCAIGIANPVSGDQVRMTNHPWSFSISDMQRELGFERLLVINDFTALALSLPGLGEGDLRQVGRGRAEVGAAIGLLGAGTGLGVSGLFRAARGGALVAIQGEGGHATLAAADDEEAQVVAFLRRRFGHASAERALSGPGLSNLHDAVREMAGASPAPLPAEEITARAGDPHCDRSVDLFFRLLGSVAGNLALTLGARGGVYVAGGVVPRLGDRIDRSRFRERFESKGRFTSYLAAIPTFLVTADVSPALMGAARALDGL
jgi:glucokinase